MQVSCPKCHRTIRASDQMAGQKVACPLCHTPFRLPVAAAVPEPRTAAPRPIAGPGRKAGPLLGMTAAVVLLAALAAAGYWFFQQRSLTTPPEVASTNRASQSAPGLSTIPDGTSGLGFSDREPPPAPEKPAKTSPPPAKPPLEQPPPAQQAPAPPPEREAPPPARPQAAASTEVILYPSPDQVDVPLWFPGNEIPDPLPQTKEKIAGYPITVTFPEARKIENARGKLTTDDGTTVPAYFSSPEEPANKKFAGHQRTTLCLIAHAPLKPDTRYQVEAEAVVDGKEWKRRWSFQTLPQERLDRKVLTPFVKQLNEYRRLVHLPPLELDAKLCRACKDHVDYIVRNTAAHPDLSWNEEDAKLPGYTKEGAKVAPAAFINGGGGPTYAVQGIVDSLLGREQFLTPDAQKLGVGYGPFLGGGDLLMAVLTFGSVSPDAPEILFPARDQKEVPLCYPPNDLPTPIPKEHQNKLAGYAITVWFPPKTPVKDAHADLVDEEDKKQEGWLSAPGQPAMEEYKQQYSLCFIPRRPLRKNTTYTATFSAQVRGQAWKRSWSFTTCKDPEKPADDLAARLLAQVNDCRKNAGLAPVRMETTLSRGCLAHARYLARNADRAEAQGMNMHKEVRTLPGYSAEGAKAAGGLISTVSNPDAAVEDWMATLYHRVPLLNPRLERIGFDCVRRLEGKWVCVLDTVNGRKEE